MAEQITERAEALLNTIKTGSAEERQAAVKELVRTYSPLLSKEYEKMGGTDDMARKTALLTVFRETLADSSALQSAEVFERSLFANFISTVHIDPNAAKKADEFSTTAMVDAIAADTDITKKAGEEPRLVFLSADDTKEQPAEPKAEPIREDAELLVGNSAAIETPIMDTTGAIPQEIKLTPKPETKKQGIRLTSKPEPKKAAEPKETPKTAPKKVKPAAVKKDAENEDDETEGNGLPGWALGLGIALGVIALLALLLLAMRSFAPSAYNGIAGVLHLPQAEVTETAEPEEVPEPSADSITIVDNSQETPAAAEPETTAETEQTAAPEQTVEPTPEPTPEGPTVIGTATVNVDKLNIRAEANTGSAAVGTAVAGKTYDVYETVTDGQYTWYRIGDGQWFADNGSWITYTKN